MNNIGFSVIFSRQKLKTFYTKLLKEMLAYGCNAIEIHTPNHDGYEQDDELVDLIKCFEYRSIHTTNLVSEAENHNEALYYQKLINVIDSAAITVHPHTMQSWSWLHNYLGDKVSFENMDWRKPFGKNVADMQKVFREYPSARWTYDLNHVYTNDSTMQLADDFYVGLNNLGHYHLSGFKDDQLPHTTLYTTHQDSIITALNTGHPIIIESFGIEDIQDFKKEYDYITEHLATR